MLRLVVPSHKEWQREAILEEIRKNEFPLYGLERRPLFARICRRLAPAFSLEEDYCERNGRNGHERLPAHFFARDPAIDMKAVAQCGGGDHRSDEKSENVSESLIE